MEETQCPVQGDVPSQLQVADTIRFRDPRAVQSDHSEQLNAASLTGTVPPRWAARPGKGAMYGKRYAAKFREEIEELFMRGEQNPALKIGPGSKWERFQPACCPSCRTPGG